MSNAHLGLDVLHDGQEAVFTHQVGVEGDHGPLLDVIDLQFYPGSSTVTNVVQYGRVFFDSSYNFPEANGVKAVNGVSFTLHSMNAYPPHRSKRGYENRNHQPKTKSYPLGTPALLLDRAGRSRQVVTCSIAAVMTLAWRFIVPLRVTR